MKGFIIANDDATCPDIPFPADDIGFEAAVAWLRFLSKTLSLENFLQILTTIGVPPHVVDMFAQAAVLCAGRGA